MDLQAAPPVVRTRTGRELLMVQQGFEPAHWRPMSTIGPGVSELKVQGERAYRVFYVAQFIEAIYVIHLFEKRSRKTSGLDLEVGRARYRQLMRHRTET